MRRRLRLFVLLAMLGAVGAVGAVGAFVAASADSHRTAHVHARLDPATPVDFSLVLRAPHDGRLHRFLAALNDPSSPGYHHFISARVFGERFGVSDQALRALNRTLRTDQIAVTASYPQRTALDVRANVGVVERVFHVGLRERRAAHGKAVLTLDGQPRIPRQLRNTVSALAGFDGTVAPLPDASSAPVADGIPGGGGGGLTPYGASVAYDMTPLYSQHILGQGERIAIVSFAGYNQSDVDGFDQQFGLPALTPVNVAVDGGTSDNNASDEQEVELDLEMSHAAAPDAQILDYNAPQSNASGADALGDVIDKIVADGRATIVSDSWGTCELGTSSGDIARDERALEAAVAHGVSFFKSAGDAGAYQCQRHNPSDHRLSVEWPSSSPAVITVGGTALSVTSSGAYAGETSWEDVLEQGGGGGGLSSDFARPSWQQGPGVVNQFSNGKRQLPDVSADADPVTGWAADTGGQIGPVGGTSAASPFWAGVLALVDQYAREHGVAHLGFVDPMFYALAAAPGPLPPFHDVTIGTNRFYPATPGWDFATGLGSPNVYNLAQDAVGYLRRHPAR